ncbi:MAG: RelA/SpoT family protein [Treponema sp.]|jgi:GTP pyrophosphokinase|nr:RelA/SpoT family protein [Treponema sp.]
MRGYLNSGLEKKPEYPAPFLARYPAAEQEGLRGALEWMAGHILENQKSDGLAILEDALRGVAAILGELRLDGDTIITALLLPLLERKLLEAAEAEKQFGPQIRNMIEGITRIAGISAKDKTIQEAENIRKMLFAMVKDIRVIFIKLADRLHTLRNLDGRPEAERKRVAQECLDIYAPLADRLGISWMKDELEDLSLKQLNREVFAQIKAIVALKKEERQDYLNQARDALLREAGLLRIPITVESRAKHFYSIYQKMRKRGKGIGDLYDLFGLRILCGGVENCYTLLGMVHRLWKPQAGRFKDYIAMRKSNGYQSLHTTVMGEGRLLEIQIRTWDMHRVAEYGIASHWLYKKGSTSELIRLEDLPLVNRLKDWNMAETGAGDRLSSESFLEDIKRELLRDSIYVFTPQGKIIELPAGATAIDFAYQIHSAVGEHCAGAKANGVIIPLNAKLQNTQVVEILTAANARPRLNWLWFAKTAKARGKIRTWLQQNDPSLILEKNVVAKKKEAEKKAEAPPRIEPQLELAIPRENLEDGIFAVRVEDEKNMMIRFARCCAPVLGEPIVGYVSRGRGIIIHRKDCPSLRHTADFQERRIETRWENAGAYVIRKFKIEARKSSNLFSEIEGAIRKYQGHLIQGKLEEIDENSITGFFTMQLEQKKDLKGVLKNIRGIPSVHRIRPG